MIKCILTPYLMLFLSFQFTDAYKEQNGTNASTEEENGRLIQHVDNLITISEEQMKELCSISSTSSAAWALHGSRQAGSAQAFFTLYVRHLMMGLHDACIVSCQVLKLILLCHSCHIHNCIAMSSKQWQ